MQVTPVRHAVHFLQRVHQALPSWSRVQGAFSALVGCFRSKPTPMTDRQISPLELLRTRFFPEGLVEKVGSGGILRQISHNRFEFIEHNASTLYFEGVEAFSEYLRSKANEVDFWCIGVADKVSYKYWDEVEGRFESFSTKNALYYSLAKDAGGIFKVIVNGTTTYVRNRSGYFSVTVQEFESEALFLETLQRDKQHRSFVLKCFAGLAAGTTVGGAAYAYYSNRPIETRTQEVALLHMQSTPVFRTSIPPAALLPNITVIEEIPYQSQEWIISDIFGSAMNGAIVTVDRLPSGIALINQPMRLVNSFLSFDAENTEAQPTAVKGNFLYTGFPQAGFFDTVDISNSLKLFTVNRMRLRVDALSVERDFAYLIARDMVGIPKLILIDISDPLNMKIIDSTVVFTGFSEIGIICKKEVCYVLFPTDALHANLHAYDVRNKTSPQLIGTLSLQYAVRAKMAMSGNTCIISQLSQSRSLILIDSSIPSELKVISSIPHVVQSYTATKTHLFLVDSDDNSGVLLIYDITDRTTPQQITNLTLSMTDYKGMAIHNSLCYISAFGAVLVVDVQDPAHPYLVNTAFLDHEPGPQVLMHKEYCILTGVRKLTQTGFKLITRGDTFALSGTPAAGTQGDYNVTLTATRRDGKNAKAALNLLVKPLSPFTIINPIANQNAFIGQLFKFHIPTNTFSAFSGRIHYTVQLQDGSPLPAWLTFINQTFAGTPGRGDTNAFSDRVLAVRLTASAGNSISSNMFDISVSGVSYAQLIVAIVGPFISGIGTAYAVYKQRALCLNWWNKKKVQRAATTAIIGQPYSRVLSVPAAQVKALITRHRGRQLAHNGQLPHGFRYNSFTNTIESDRVLDPGELGVLTIQVIGEADKILEQFDLRIAHTLLDISIDSKALSLNYQEADAYVQL